MELVMRIMRRGMWYFCSLLPVQKNKIVFVSYYGRGYSDNPKYVAEELLKSDKKIEYVWTANDKANAGCPDGFKLVKLNSFAFIYHMSTAKIWVDNARKYWCLKKPSQKYIQLWHGGFGLKKIEKDAGDKLEDVYIKMAKNDAAKTDLMVSNSRTLTNLYKNAFWYPDGEILEVGLPRNDRLFNVTKEEIDSIKEKLNISKDVKLALYAPTFRQNHNLDVYNMDYKAVADALSKKFGGQWKILIRLHPNVFKLSDNLSFPEDCAVNVSKYNDIQELYMISDIAITDYSSVMFDFTITGRPCFLYASDVESYRKERDFFITLDSLPYPLAQNNDEFINNIENFDEEKYNEKVKEFTEYHGFCDDGNASKKVAQWILDKMN